MPVSITALYDKVNRTEPAVIRALVAGSAERLGPVLGALAAQPQVTVPGFQLRGLDGNHLAASEKRLKPLRGFAGAALPGQSLVVYDPDLGMVTDLIACEDGHTQERALMGPLLAAARPGGLWLADRSFCTRAILGGWQQRGSCFLVREHAANPNPRPLGQLQKIGLVDTGTAYEQAVAIDDAAGTGIILRRIELHLDAPGEDGDTVIRLLSNVAAAKLTARERARLYRNRWRNESMFQRLESVLQSEIPTLGQSRAALFACGVVILAYNVLALIGRAITIQHQLDPTKIRISTFFLSRHRDQGHLPRHGAGDRGTRMAALCPVGHAPTRADAASHRRSCRSARVAQPSSRTQATLEQEVRLPRGGATPCRDRARAEALEDDMTSKGLLLKTLP